ncbi:MAG: hypothetical protein NTV22_00665, partial [bacterium]|nr:hypothetical protein [bacterium]
RRRLPWQDRRKGMRLPFLQRNLRSAAQNVANKWACCYNECGVGTTKPRPENGGGFMNQY